MKSWIAQGAAWLVLPLLVACGGGSTGGATATTGTSTAPGALLYPNTAPLGQVSLSADQFKASLTANASGASLYALATGGVPGATLPCGVEAHKLEFYTTGGAGETTHSSAALMVPTGPGCTGPRPIVLYAHGTAFEKSYDISALQLQSNPANSESALIAAMYASNGFIVVAPNYAGFDDSNLAYHPYLNASQQAGEMTDALAAARLAIPLIGSVADNGRLFVTGYSAGGHVAMATVRHLEATGVKVTGSVPMSGNYTMGAFGDAIFLGNVNIGGTLFLPLIATSYQHAYGNLYSSPGELYSAQYASGIDTLLPSAIYSPTQLFTQGLLPQTAVFDSTPPAPYTTLPQNPNASLNGDFGFGTSFLITDDARYRYLADVAQHPDPALAGTGVLPTTAAASRLRQDAIRNDLRSLDGGAPGLWLPHSAMLLCAGGSDPTVFALNTRIQAAYFAAAAAQSVPGAVPLVLNIDPASQSTAQLGSSAGLDTQFAALEGAFNQVNTGLASAGGAAQALQAYHGNVAPFCTAASLLFIKNVLSALPPG